MIGDIASLMAKFSKPLNARLIPVAAEKSGDSMDFRNTNPAEAVHEAGP